MRAAPFLAVVLAVALGAALVALGAAVAQGPLAPAIPLESVEQGEQALARAQQQGEQARRRAEALESEALTIREAAERTAQESAATAARIQQSEAEIAAQEARIGLIERQQTELRARLAERQRPLVRLTAALQRLSRRPPALALLRPGSLQDAVRLRAVLETMLPEVDRRTAGLRSELNRARALQDQARQVAAGLRASQGQLGERRKQLAALETRQRLESRAVGGVADREAARALALKEQARDLTGLVDELARAGALRADLAALPGPVLRPDQPQAAQVGPAGPAMIPPAQAPARYLLPVAGRLVAGFGAQVPGQPGSRGISILTRAEAQAVAPGAGRVVFAGPYQGYGAIVIIEHGGGWTSLLTGLSTVDARVGDQLVAGAPLGRTGNGRPVLTLELRKDGAPVNPLDLLRG
jgi:septal ring factor EnvC (AmiA/AmiB activator)